jgi:integrase
MTRHSTGTIRQRRPDVWEVRVCVGADPVSGQPVQRSVTVHGNLAEAERRRALLAAQAEQLRGRGLPPMRTIAELLAVWLAAEHDWKPSTWEGYRQTARRLSAEPLARRAPATVSPPVLRTAMRAWERSGVPISTSALWARTLKAALGWAFDERLLPCQPLQGMRGPGQPAPRRDVPLPVIRELLQAAVNDVEHLASSPPSTDRDRRLHTAEQVRLLLRLAADTGARRGELGALSVDDIHGRVLHIARGISAEVVTTTKTGRSRRVTVGASTALLWEDTLHVWRARLPADEALGPWLFSADADHRERLRCSTLGHWFQTFVRRHGHFDVCLHRLRHTVATVLVADGQLLQAQQRLGHAEASTTLRQYCHALPLEDEDVANHLGNLLDSSGRP